MRIGINATNAVLKNKTGIGIYTLNLIKNLAKVDNKNEYILYYNFQKVKRTEFLKLKNKNFKHKYFIPKFFKFNFDRLDIIHDTSFRLIKLNGAKSVVTIHDTTSLFNDDFMSEKFRKKARRRLKRSIIHSDKIIAVSKNTKQDIIKYFNIPADKVGVVYNGVDERFFLKQNKKQARLILTKKYGLQDKYILFVGTIETRKNILNLLMAYIKAKTKIKGIKLVLIGGKGFGYHFINKSIAELKKEGVVYYNYIDNKDLSLFYRCAETFVYPSLYEGFGIPVIEAFAYGLPVVTSNNSSLKEIGKKYTIYVDPFNIESIADGIIKSLRKEPKERENERREYSRRFSWETAALKTLKVYEGIK